MEPYRKAYEKDKNYTAWLNGMYHMHAVGAAFSKTVKYPNKPFDSNNAESNLSDAERFELYALELNKNMKAKDS